MEHLFTCMNTGAVWWKRRERDEQCGEEELRPRTKEFSWIEQFAEDRGHKEENVSSRRKLSSWRCSGQEIFFSLDLQQCCCCCFDCCCCVCWTSPWIELRFTGHDKLPPSLCPFKLSANTLGQQLTDRQQDTCEEVRKSGKNVIWIRYFPVELYFKQNRVCVNINVHDVCRITE